ncbi:hypothetical protein TA3x_003289 [Tundrisphaera sp. TA3]|uniref:hypothetical protein n=1 Tax=Tundrisphaera sp. TA3 TaxID=3435775 RepID=UPI003EBA427E
MAMIWWALAASPDADARQIRPAPPSPRPRIETLARPGGESLTGRLIGEARSGFRFRPDGGAAPIPLRPGSVISFDGPAADAVSGTPPMRVVLGLDQQVSGRLGSVDAASVRLEGGPGLGPVVVARGGALGLNQRPGEALVFRDGFETLEAGLWSEVGLPEVVSEPRLVGEKSLRIPAGGSAITRRLAEPVNSGRLEVAFHDDGRVVAGQQWFVDLLFRGAAGPETVRALLDWGEESLAVLSSGGPALPVQRLARRPGWHRLVIRFGPGVTDLSVGGDQLAHGRGPSGPLVEIRLANQSNGPGIPPEDLAVHFDDLRLVRLAEPVGNLEVDPTQDVVRLADDGDQLFGRFVSADADAIRMDIDGRVVSLTWSEVAGIDFRRVPAPSRPIDGLLIRVAWRSAPGVDPGDLDRVEGALIALADDAMTVATPYAGDLVIPRDRLEQVEILGQGTRMVLDATAHHLGNEASRKPPLLDPPLPEGGVLERSFVLEAVPDRPAFLVLDVVQVVGEANHIEFSAWVRAGEIRTSALVNGQKVDYLNRHITTHNETPERIRLPIPPGLLRAGENRVRIEQAGKKTDPGEFDDFGLLMMALEFDAPPPEPGSP